MAFGRGFPEIHLIEGSQNPSENCRFVGCAGKVRLKETTRFGYKGVKEVSFPKPFHLPLEDHALSWKNKLRQIKDFFLPGRKYRREYMARLSHQITNLELELAASRLSNEDQAKTIADVDSKSQAKLDDLTQQVGQLNPALQAIHQILEQHQSQLGSSNRQNQKLESQISFGLQRLDSMDSMRSEITALANLQTQSQIDLKLELKQELKEELKQELKEEVKAELQPDILAIKEEQHSIPILNHGFSALEQKMTAIAAKLDEFDNSALEANSIRERQQSELVDLRQVVNSLGMALQASGQRISTLNSKFETQQHIVSEAMENLAETSRKFQMEKEDYSSRLKEMGGAVETYVQQFNNRMGNLLQGMTQLAQTDTALSNRSTDLGDILKFSQDSSYRKSPKFCGESFSFYSREVGKSELPFIYLDLKSIPRSGLHYFQRTMAALLERHVSFCEWYNEPGCCQKMPCALTGFANQNRGSLATNLRMVKSHDFDLDDPVFPTSEIIQRRILIRDPLFSLTSWWTLDVLTRNSELLRRHGISLTKINYLHESAVLNSAYAMIDSEGEIPSLNELAPWLKTKSAYSLGFINKWSEGPERENIVFYKNVNLAIEQLVTQLQTHLPADAQARIETWRGNKSDGFKSRTNPFSSSSKKIADFLEKHSDLFMESADEIVRSDSTNLFRESLEPSALIRTIA